MQNHHRNRHQSNHYRRLHRLDYWLSVVIITPTYFEYHPEPPLHHNSILLRPLASFLQPHHLHPSYRLPEVPHLNFWKNQLLCRIGTLHHQA